MDRRADAELGVDRPPGSGRALTRLVIDASAALHALAGPRGMARLARYELVAPPLLWSELTSSVRQRVFRAELSPALGRRILEALAASSITRMLPDDLYAEAFALAERRGWAKTYDAEYIALAKLLDCPLLTADARLSRGAASIVETVPPTGL